MSTPRLVLRGMPDPAKLRRLRWLALLILIPIVVFTTYYTVPAESVGVVLRFGKYMSTEDPGLHFKLPMVESMRYFRTDVQSLSPPQLALSISG